MTIQPPPTALRPTLWTTMMSYVVPPLVIPVLLLLAVLLFAFIHGPEF